MDTWRVEMPQRFSDFDTFEDQSSPPVLLDDDVEDDFLASFCFVGL